MLTGPVRLSVQEPTVDRREILRYAGCPKPSESDLALLEECLAEAEAPGVLRYEAVVLRVPVETEGGICRFPGIEASSQDLAKHLAGCREAFLMGCTIGVGADVLIRRYGAVSPAKGLMMQAIGAERAESLADALSARLSENVREEGLALTRRFSPGYGDLPLSFQRDLFRVLPLGKIGLTLNEGLMMSPSKSVTAVAGLLPAGTDCGDEPGSCCASCASADCPYRIPGTKNERR